MRLSDKLVEEDTRFGHTCSGEEEITKYNAIMNSNISILRLWISIFSRETVIIYTHQQVIKSLLLAI